MFRAEIRMEGLDGGKAAELRGKVERANHFLEVELSSLGSFDISACWRLVPQREGRSQVLLDLTADYLGKPMGLVGYPLDVEIFSTDAKIRAGLDRPTWVFANLLTYLNKVELKYDQDRVNRSLAVGV
jgi:hypothetical protein